MYPILFLILLALVYLFIFFIAPRATHVLVTKLLTYHKYSNTKYEEHPVRYRAGKIVRVYIWMSLVLSLVFIKVFELGDKELIIDMNPFIFFAVASFFLIFNIRITILMNKTKIIEKISKPLGRAR